MSQVITITKNYCPSCLKEKGKKVVVKEVSRIKFGPKIWVKSFCGHVFLESNLITENSPNSFTAEHITSLDNKKLFPFQVETVNKVINEANCVALIAEEMGLGKTVENLAIFKLLEDAILPALIVCKSSVKWQWFKQALTWCSYEHENSSNSLLTNEEKLELQKKAAYAWTGQVIESSDDLLIPGFKLYITSYDMLNRFGKKRGFEELKQLGIKTICIDECQHIKNHKSARSKALREITDHLEVKQRLASSGTPIKNAPLEFFSVLNWLRPDRFYSLEHFDREFVDYAFDYKTGKYKVNGIRNIEYFKELTKDLIFRHTRKEVKDQIGLKSTEAFRDFQYLDIDKDLKKAYAEQEEELIDFTNSAAVDGKNFSFSDYSHILALLAKLRHLAGLSKVSWCEDFVSQWLTSNTELNTRGFEPKLCLFTHHIDVAKFLLSCVQNICGVESYDWKPLYLPSGLTSTEQDDLQNEFNFGKSRILIASTLGSGEGINLQHNCSNSVFLERQWNPANEEQAESRFIRIGQDSELVTCTYPTVLGTIDEYFTELVEKKRRMFTETMGDSEERISWEETETVLALTKAITSKRGGKRWSY